MHLHFISFGFSIDKFKTFILGEKCLNWTGPQIGPRGFCVYV